MSTTAANPPWQLRILLVDDVEFTRDIVARMLETLGHRIDTASSGPEALQHGRQHIFDLVLMDIHMPGTDGLETTRLWRTPGNGMLDPDTPIMALTANASPGEKREAVRAGMNGYLTKPASQSRLVAAIEQTFRLQLSRGIEMTPHPVLQRPLLDTSDPAIATALRTSLLSTQARLRMAWCIRARARLLGDLHSLKGCAGQAGMLGLHRLAEQLETRTVSAGWPSRLAIRALHRALGRRLISMNA